MDTVTLVVSFLGGSATAAILTQLNAARVAEKQRKLQQLDEQIRELYGPLFYLVSQSERLFSLNARFHDAYKAEYIDQKYPRDPIAREQRRSETMDTIGLANQYVKQVEANNEKISSLLDSKFSYIDPDDIEPFLLFFEHYTRMTTERDEKGRSKLRS
jgi:hypothetical protein